MTREELFAQIKKKRSFLCVGLDTDVAKIPDGIRLGYGDADAIFEFNRAIVDATAPYAVAFKPNLAFYEAAGADGVDMFEKTCAYIREKYPEIFVIADAKRGDIGNTSEMYARAFFDTGFADAVTLSPYMGRDTVDPFLKYDGKWAVVLALTSNKSAEDFEMLKLANGKLLYEQVLETSAGWGTPDNMMYVVGATQAGMLSGIRKIVPDHFLLVPGVGAQGGSLQEVAEYGMNRQCGLLVNSSRGIIYADRSENFAKTAGEKAREMQEEMAVLLERYL